MIGALLRAPRAAWMWAAAAWVALGVLRRIWRGEVVVMSGHAAPVIRLVALALVFLASCAEKLRPGPAQEQAPPDLSRETAEPVAPEAVVALPPEFPDDLDDAAIEHRYAWLPPRSLHRYFEAEPAAPDAARSVLSLSTPPRLELADRVARLQLQIGLHVARAWAGEPHVPEAMIDLLDAAESLHVFDEWLAGHLWRHARTIEPAPVQLLARLDRHLKIVHALALAEAETGPIEFSAWRSKAAPPRGWVGLQVPPGLAAAARAAYRNGADAGTWASEATLPLRVVAGSPTLVRGGVATSLAVGATLELRRLDVVRAGAGARLMHDSLGELTVASGAELAAWNVESRLSPPARARLTERVEVALLGDSAALAELEAVLPAAHPAIRAAVLRRPEAPGAAGLRMLLVAFDE